MRFRVVIDRHGTAPAARGFEWFAAALDAALRECADDCGTWTRDVILGMTEAARPLPPGAIVYNAEQVGASAPYWQHIGRYAQHVVWDFSVANRVALMDRGARLVVHCPPGYMPCMERIAPVTEDVDVLFYGAMNERRQEIVRRLQQAGLTVRALTSCWGADLDAEIARAKVVLNLHYYPGAAHEIFRTGYLFANRKCVVSEVGSDADLEALASAAAFVVSYEDVVDACARLAADTSRRRAVANRGYERFRREDLVQTVRRALAASGIE